MKRIEAEKNELVLQNESGTYAIIPANKREEVKRLLSEGCYDCIDRIVESLPKASDYAEGGTVIDPPTKDWRTYSKEFDAIPYNLDKEINERFINRSNKSKLQDENKWIAETKENIKQRRINEKIKYIADKLIKNNPQGNMSRVDYLEQFGDEAEDIIKTVYPKFSPTLWQETARGLESLTEANLSSTINNIANNKNFTSSEKADMLLKYSDNPIMSKAFDNLSSLKVLDIPGKLIQSIYKEDYTGADALQGKQNNAGTVEEIVTDPLNVLGLSAVKNALIPTKGIVLKKGKELSRFKKKQNIKKILNPAAIGTNISSTVNDASSVTENIKAADGLVIDPPAGLEEMLKEYNSPMTVDDFVYVSRDTGIGVDALVTQALLESSLGTKGKGAKGKNPLNWGNDDEGNIRTYNSYREGLLTAAKGLKEKFYFTTPEDFMARDFKGKYGVYATDPEYKTKYNKYLNFVRENVNYQPQSEEPVVEKPTAQPAKEVSQALNYDDPIKLAEQVSMIQNMSNEMPAISQEYLQDKKDEPEITDKDLEYAKAIIARENKVKDKDLKYLPLQVLVKTLGKRNNKYSMLSNNPAFLSMLENKIKNGL
jgi:hypothetical protein